MTSAENSISARAHVGHEVALCVAIGGRAFMYCSTCREEISVGHLGGYNEEPCVVSGVLRDVDGRLELAGAR